MIVQIIEEEFMSKRMTMAQRINRKKKKGKKSLELLSVVHTIWVLP